MIKSDPKHPQIQCQHLPRAPEPARTPGLEPRRDRMGASHAPGVLGCLYSTTRMCRRRHARSTCVHGLRRLEPPSYRTPWPTSALQDPRKPPIWALVTASRLCAEHTCAQPAPLALRSDGTLGMSRAHPSVPSPRASLPPPLQLSGPRGPGVGLACERKARRGDEAGDGSARYEAIRWCKRASLSCSSPPSPSAPYWRAVLHPVT